MCFLGYGVRTQDETNKETESHNEGMEEESVETEPKDDTLYVILRKTKLFRQAIILYYFIWHYNKKACWKRRAVKRFILIKRRSLFKNVS